MEREEHPLLEPAGSSPGGTEATLSSEPELGADIVGDPPSAPGEAEGIASEPWPDPVEEPESQAAAGPSDPLASEPQEPSDEPDRKWIPLAVGGGLLLLLIAGVAALWQTRSELSSARTEISALKQSARRSELFQARSAVVRARAELEPLGEVLPADLAAEVRQADGILAGIADRLKASK